MTYFEKLEQEHPDFIGPQYPGGVALCPDEAGYEKVSPCPVNQRIPVPTQANCYACWRRTIPGTEADG